jgi:phage-related protein
MSVMSDLFYNRDENISGVALQSALSGIGTPSYGSSVSFNSKLFQYDTKDSYTNTLPNSLNNLEATFNLRYETNEINAQKAAVFFEDKHVNNQHYELDASIVVDQSPNLLNWSGMNFINYTLVNWATSTSYDKFDIIYSGVNTNKLNNFYYCTEDHTSSSTSADGPTGSSSKWSQEFFFEPDIGFNNSVNFKNERLEFKNSFRQRVKSNDNNATFPVDYSFKNISNKQLKAMVHFLETKGGYRNFRHQIPSIYNRPKVFYSPSWTHTWNYFNSNDLQVSLVEDVLGIIPTDT